MRRYFLLSSLIFVVACGATKVMAPVQADADRGAAKFPDLSLAQLTEGKAVYDQNCGACHKAPKPRSQSEGAWRQIVPKMVAKSNRKMGNTIDATKEESLLRFLIVMGSK
jgi:cytochrome c5